jgi:RNA recognition motif-containing protein
VDELVLAGAFSLFGPVAASKIVRSAKGQQSRGYGFVTFHHSQHAIFAVEAVQQLMSLLKSKDGGVLDKLTVDYSTSAHTD